MASALDDVLDAIARAVDPAGSVTHAVGSVTLHPHQVSAVLHLRSALAEFGGALLADAPGLGKTFVALAVASAYPRCVVAAPASLRSMWRDAASSARVPIQFISLEALSRSAKPAHAPLVIVDEAHRVSSPAARRYARVASLAHRAHLLLLTATPVRNRRAELTSLLALFLGSEAAQADDALVASCVVRRDHLAGNAVPPVIGTRPIRPRARATIATALRELPPPLAVADGTPAPALVATVLARCWASSLAALEIALVRRLQRGAAIRAALADGRLPSRSELNAWMIGDDAMQLAFPFVASPTASATIPESIDALDRHLTAVAALRNSIRFEVARDSAWRAHALQSICARHNSAIVVAFTGFEATAKTLYQQLKHAPGVALITGRRAVTAGGPVARAAILDVLAERSDRALGRGPDGRFDVRLVIATDLLSEGANLQRASVIVHLDDPWTPASVAQRVGRSARLGSVHDGVHVYRFAPPLAAEALLSVDRIHRAKRSAAKRALAPGDAMDRVRATVKAWRTGRRESMTAVVAACDATRDGFVAVMADTTRTWLIGGRRRGNTWAATARPAQLLALVRAVRRVERSPPRAAEIASLARTIDRWTKHETARTRSGIGQNASPARRRLLMRLDHLVVSSTPSGRASLTLRVGRLRTALATARGAEVERWFAEMLARPPDASEWLDDAERWLSTATARPHGEKSLPELAAILILRRADSAAEQPLAAASVAPLPTAPAAPAPSAGPSAASPETAAPP